MRFTHILAAALVALGMSLTADEIPKGTSKTSPDAATCGLPYDPFPYLRNCSSPIDKGLPDLRGTWEAPLAGGLRTYQERVEQCEDRFTVTGKSSKSGLYFIHDFKHADGTLANFYNVASFPDCVRETVFGNMSANCMYMWHVANNGTGNVSLGASRCLQTDGTVEFFNAQLVQMTGGPLKLKKVVNDSPEPFSPSPDFSGSGLRASSHLGAVVLLLAMLLLQFL